MSIYEIVELLQFEAKRRECKAQLAESQLLKNDWARTAGMMRQAAGIVKESGRRQRPRKLRDWHADLFGGGRTKR